MYIDNYNKSTDNSSIDDNNDNYEVVELKNLKNLIDPDCTHYFVKDNDEIDKDSQAWVCRKCNRGTFLPKSVTIINS